MRKTTDVRRLIAGIGAGALTAALAAGITPVLACADGTAEEHTNELLQEVAASNPDESFDYLEGQTTSKKSSLKTKATTKSLPSKLDLRDKGVVTPVKFQNPWGTCWAFGITAAAETSILSELGTTYAATGLDLSEHHLAWFAKNHIAAKGEEGYEKGQTQAGEGMWIDSEDLDDQNASMSGGMPYFGAYTYAAGMGVVDEEDAPYYGKNKWVEVRVDGKKTDLTMTYDEALKAGYTKDQIRCYSTKDDWTLSESERFEQMFPLEESSILPSVTPEYNQDTGEYELNEEGVNAIKSELNAGRAVNIAYLADSSDPNKETPTASQNRYMNNANGEWAQFTWSDGESRLGANHSVTIVGYDDNYSKENFTQKVNPAKWDEHHNVIFMRDGVELPNDKDGDPIDPVTGVKLDKNTLEVAREDTNLTTPSGDGAWIVKNSWGSSSEDFPNSNCGKGWGIDGSGYFYLSYYDMSVCCAETFDFAVTSEEADEYGYSLCYQHDLMPSASTMSNNTLYAVSMANAFKSDEPSKVSNVSCVTATPGTHVEFEFYLINKKSDSPTDGKLVSTAEADYTYGGFHRAELDKPVYLKKGQLFAVVVTETIKNGGGTVYSLNFNRSSNMLQALLNDEGEWMQGVINEGESFLGVAGDDGMTWTDWSDFTTSLKAVNVDQSMFYDYDNFGIKAYGAPLRTQPVKNSSCKKTFKAVNGKLAAAKHFNAKLAKVKNNAKVKYSRSAVTAKAKKYITVAANGKVTVKKGLAKGAYKLKVKCAVSATKHYMPATAYITYKIKVK